MLTYVNIITDHFAIYLFSSIAYVSISYNMSIFIHNWSKESGKCIVDLLAKNNHTVDLIRFHEDLIQTLQKEISQIPIRFNAINFSRLRENVYKILKNFCTIMWAKATKIWKVSSFSHCIQPNQQTHPNTFDN